LQHILLCYLEKERERRTDEKLRWEAGTITEEKKKFQNVFRPSGKKKLF